jgi:hypothetical protein
LNIRKRQAAKKTAGGGFFSPSGLQFRLCRGAAIDPRSLAISRGETDFPARECPIKKPSQEAKPRNQAKKPAMSGPGLLQG